MKMIHLNIILGLNIMENMLHYVKNQVQCVNIVIFGIGLTSMLLITRNSNTQASEKKM